MIKVIHNVGWYFPEAGGGTEVYVDALISEARKQGVYSIVAAPSSGEEEKHYEYNGTQVYRYPDGPTKESKQLGLEKFTNWLRNQNADILHQHSTTYSCSVPHLVAAKKLGMKVIKTIHLSTPICLRTTMLYLGEKTCDGKIVDTRCAGCLIQAKGIPVLLSQWIGRLPLGLSRFFKKNFSNSIAKMFGKRAGVTEHLKMFDLMDKHTDLIIALCDWMQQALEINGVSKNKIKKCRLGTPINISYVENEKEIGSPKNSKIKFGFAGRWDKIKGIELLIRAFKNVPKTLQAELEICAVAFTEEAKRYESEVVRMCADDSRIKIKSFSRDQIYDVMSQFDVLVIPSQVLELGPLVLLEALSMKIPVLGSDLGAIKENINQGSNGWLVKEYRNESEWTKCISFLAQNPNEILKAKKSIGKVKTMLDVTNEMLIIYKDLMGF